MTDPHANADTAESTDDLIGYVTDNGRGDYFTACPDCADETSDTIDTDIHDGEYYGEQIPYPECFYCGEVIRPHE